ncbi:MAG: Asp-tRNA(Asn)/Glu-tRNA(Gln) amidotransferase subunit GatB [Chloroflexota bacterium]
MTKYEPVIGLEVHAELMTRSKMFCGCRVVDSVESPPNTAVCPVCLGMPGMLPVINKRALEMAMRVGLALHCAIQTHNVFARKNYFYPDLPKGYQISQYELPLATHGWLDIDLPSGETKRIGIRRVHVEEDTAKLTHLEVESSESKVESSPPSTFNLQPSTVVDFNRSGVPLLEIVSEPDLSSEEEARLYGMKLRQLLRYLGVNSGDMEKGVIRFEANVSVRPAGSDQLGTRTEVKNLNSFRALVGSIAYEVERQAAILEVGGRVQQDTLGWNETRRETYSQRGKEEAHDYRYFPEPDLPPLDVAAAWVEEVQATLPELPDAKATRYRQSFGLSAYDARVLTEERPVAEWFEAAIAAGGDPKAVANWMINELFRLMNESKLTINYVNVTPAGLVELISLVDRQVINNNTAKEVLAEMFQSGRSAATIVEARGLAQISDEAALAAVVAEVIRSNPNQVASYLAGKEQLRGWLVGQVMKATKGKGNPALIHKLMTEQLAQLVQR